MSSKVTVMNIAVYIDTILTVYTSKIIERILACVGGMTEIIMASDLT